MIAVLAAATSTAIPTTAIETTVVLRRDGSIGEDGLPGWEGVDEKDSHQPADAAW